MYDIFASGLRSIRKSHQIFSGSKKDKILGQTSEKFGDNLRFCGIHFIVENHQQVRIMEV